MSGESMDTYVVQVPSAQVLTYPLADVEMS